MKIKLQNVGGITQPTSIELKPGLNVIRAPNATGKTSFTHAINIVSMDNLELREHPEFVNDFSANATVEIEDEKGIFKRVVDMSSRKPLSKNLPIYRINGRGGIIFANPENEFLATIIRGQPIDKFLSGFSDAKYYQELIKKEGVLKQLMDSLNEEYGNENSNAKDAIKIKEKLEKYNEELKKLQDKKIKLQIELDKSKRELLKDKKIKDELAVLTNERNKYDEIIGIGNGKIKGLNTEMEQLQFDTDYFKRELQKFDDKHPNLDNEIQELAKKAEEMRQELEGIEDSDEKGRYDEMKSIEFQIESCESNIDTKKNICLSCGQKFTSREVRLKHLNKEKDKLDDEIKDLESELEKTEEEKTNLKENIQAEYAEKERALEVTDAARERNLADSRDWNAKLEDTNKKLEKNIEKMKELKKNISPKLNTLLAREEIFNEKIKDKIEDIEESKLNYDLLSPSIKRVEIISARFNFLKKVIEIVKIKLVESKNAVKDKFNDKIKEVYKILGFKDFKNIEIDSTFRIVVTRKNRIQELNRLSTSERVTIGVIVMLAGKEEYLPEFPFFVLDEVTTAYDPTRFKKIIDYLANETKTKYTIVTAFSPTGDKIKVEYSL